MVLDQAPGAAEHAVRFKSAGLPEPATLETMC